MSTWTVASTGGDFTTLDAALADASVVNGDIIECEAGHKINAGNTTISVTKQVTVRAMPDGQHDGTRESAAAPYIEFTAKYPLELRESNVWFEGIRIKCTYSSSSFIYGIGLFGANGKTNFGFKRCIFDWGVGGSQNNIISHGFWADEWYLINNIFYIRSNANSSAGFIRIIEEGFSNSSGNGYMVNNTVVNDCPDDVQWYLSGGPTATAHLNNLIINGRPTDYLTNSYQFSKTPTLASNNTGWGATHGDANFVDNQDDAITVYCNNADDANPVSGAPSIGTGYDASAYTTIDALGNTRSAWDRGAIEFQAVAGGALPLIGGGLIG